MISSTRAASQARAASVAATSSFVTPASADTTTIGFKCRRSATISIAFATRCASPTDVPPNLMMITATLIRLRQRGRILTRAPLPACGEGWRSRVRVGSQQTLRHQQLAFSSAAPAARESCVPSATMRMREAAGAEAATETACRARDRGRGAAGGDRSHRCSAAAVLALTEVRVVAARPEAMTLRGLRGARIRGFASESEIVIRCRRSSARDSSERRC